MTRGSEGDMGSEVVRWCRVGYAIRVHALDGWYKPESPRFHGEGRTYCGRFGVARIVGRLEVPRCEDCEAEVKRRNDGTGMPAPVNGGRVSAKEG